MSSNPVAVAYDQVADGQIDVAVKTLEEAGSRGDSVAMAELAAWYLRGEQVARDLVRARSALRRAVEIGHVDAALMEIAFTASGTGGPMDWPAALSLLTAAAVNDPLAAEQLALIEQMTLDAAGYPCGIMPRETLSQDPLIFLIHDAFSEAECRHLANLAHDKLEPAVVVDPASGRGVPHPVRTSFGTAIGPAQEDLVVAAINRRIAIATTTALENGEPLQVLRYGPGQQYRLHSDALTAVDNQRTVTAIVYLNHGFMGGDTDFPELSVRVKPRAGSMLVFHNALSDGRADPRTRHAGLPVTKGTKWVATRWIRGKEYNPWTDHHTASA